VAEEGLLEALSAQIWSLSEKVVDDCLLTMTGGFQLFLFATIEDVSAGAPSMRETAIASKPLNGAAPGTAAVRLE